ncbi:hypothetical protein Tco_0819927 [Tanacetum coccineum]|uniref:Retrotransposon gag domain-containing protein n=1 Tax=Tanacetum coccineum TaxID=301880 RepID=A0ABQ5AC90_9ASTR
MFLNIHQLQKQLDKDEFQEDGSMAAFWVLNRQFQQFINSQVTLDYESQMTDKYFAAYTGIEVKQFRETLLQHMGNVKKYVAERTRHQRQYDRRFSDPYMNEEQMAKVMAISVISISSDSSEDSVGTPAGRVILFGTIPTTIPDTTPVITPPATQTDTPVIPTETPIIAPTIPPSPDYTPASPDYSPASEFRVLIIKDPSSDHIPPLPDISPFLSSDDDPTDNHLSYLIASYASSTWEQPIPRTTVTATILMPVQLDDRKEEDLPGTSAGPSRKRRRSPMTSVPALSHVSGELSPVRADLVPSPKRVKDSGYLADVEVDPRGISLRDDTIVRVSDEPHLEQDSDPEIQAEIDECFAYADALRDRGIDARVVVETVDRDETETGVRGPVEVRVERVTHPVMPEDIPEPAQEGSVEVTYETLGDLVQRFHDHTQAIPVHRIQTIEGVQREQGHRIVGVESAVIALTERLAELERDNRRLRGTMSVESQRVDRLQRGMSRMQRELRQMRRLRFYDRVRVGRLEAKMPSTRSGASMTREEFEELVARRVAEELEAREAARTLEPLNENGDELEGENGGNGNGNGGNGNGNGGNGNGNGGNGENKNGN